MFTVPKNTVIDKKLIEQAIKENESLRSDYNRKWDYYKGEHDIVKRVKLGALKNNKTVINHARYITGLYTSYLIGNPVDYTLEKQSSEIPGSEKALEMILEEFKKQTISDLDIELELYTSIFGRTYERNYVNEESEVRSAQIDPRNCIVAYDNTIEHKKVFAVIYGDVDSTKNEYKDVTVLTEKEVITYNDKLEEEERKPHNFLEVPVIEYRNDPLCKGDFEDSISLINAYNIIQSDRINDKEQLVEAILLLYGITLTDEQLAILKEDRVLGGLPTDGKAEYLTKILNESELTILKKDISNDIHKVSMTPDMTDDNFVGNASGVAISFKLLPFEWNTKNKERYFEKGLKNRFKLYNNYLKTFKSIAIIPTYMLDIVFKRSLPQNDFETSQMMNNLSDFVDRETLVGRLSFVKDASEIVDKKAKERAEALTELEASMGTQEPNATNEE